MPVVAKGVSADFPAGVWHSGESACSHLLDGAEAGFPSEQIGDEAAAHGSQAEAHHGMAGRGDEIRQMRDGAEVGNAVG